MMMNDGDDVDDCCDDNVVDDEEEGEGENDDYWKFLSNFFHLMTRSIVQVYFGAIQERLLQCDYKHRLRI